MAKVIQKEKYVAHYSEGCEYETFDSFEDAQKWLQEQWDEDGHNDGFTEETISGQDFIAKITHRSHFNILKKKENYIWNEEEGDYFLNGDIDSDRWESDFDLVGNIELKESTP